MPACDKDLGMKNSLFLLVMGLLTSASSMADGVAVPAGAAGLLGGGAGAQGPGGIMSFAPIILMFGVIYFLMIRPQQKKAREQQDMIKALKHGDEIVTSSGMLGKITGITEKVVTLELADNVRVKMLKNQVSQVLKGSIKELA